MGVRTNVIFQFGKILSPHGLRHVEPQVGLLSRNYPCYLVMRHERRKDKSLGRSTAKHCLNPYNHNSLSEVTCCNTYSNTIPVTSVSAQIQHQTQKISAKTRVHKYSKHVAATSKKSRRHTDDIKQFPRNAQILGTTVKISVAQAIWHPGIVHPCVKTLFLDL